MSILFLYLFLFYFYFISILFLLLLDTLAGLAALGRLLPVLCWAVGWAGVTATPHCAVGPLAIPWTLGCFFGTGTHLLENKQH